jgi:hypothetical protein
MRRYAWLSSESDGGSKAADLRTSWIPVLVAPGFATEFVHHLSIEVSVECRTRDRAQQHVAYLSS